MNECNRILLARAPNPHGPQRTALRGQGLVPGSGTVHAHAIRNTGDVRPIECPRRSAPTCHDFPGRPRHTRPGCWQSLESKRLREPSRCAVIKHGCMVQATGTAIDTVLRYFRGHGHGNGAQLGTGYSPRPLHVRSPPGRVSFVVCRGGPGLGPTGHPWRVELAWCSTTSMPSQLGWPLVHSRRPPGRRDAVPAAARAAWAALARAAARAARAAARAVRAARAARAAGRAAWGGRGSRGAQSRPC